MTQGTCANGHPVAVLTPESRFCEDCGAPLQALCPNGHQVAPSLKFCTTCGAALGPAPAGQAVLASSRDTQQVPASAEPSTPAPSSPPQIPIYVPTRGGRSTGLVVAIVVAAVLLLGAGVTTAVVLLHKSQPVEASVSANGDGASPTSPTTDPAVAAANQLNGLLQSNAQNRSAVQGATQQIASCGDLTTAIQALQTSAASRQQLLTQLNTIDLSALSNGSMLAQDLTTAWQNSIASDNSYAQWGQDEQDQGCTPNDNSDSNFQSAQGTDAQATAAKQAFVDLWNPLAAQYGLPTWQWDQI